MFAHHVLIVAVALAPLTAKAAEWQTVSSSPTIVMQIDVKSVVQLKSGERKAWQEFIYMEPQKTSDNRTYRRALALSIYRCADRTAANLQNILYDNAESGTVIDNSTRPLASAQFFDVAPDSFNEAALEFVCAAKVKR